MPSKRKPEPVPTDLTDAESDLEELVPALDLPMETTMEGFSMSDDPPEDEIRPFRPGEPVQRDPSLEAPTPRPYPESPTMPARPGAAADLKADIRYESRIRILEAFQYLGSLTNAPDWINRNWAAWAEYDETKKLEAGPALRVPLEGPVAEKLCRRGDYIVRQEVALTRDLVDVRLEVWSRADFERFFLPLSPSST